MEAGQDRDRGQRVPMTRQILTREEVLQWNSAWSYTDREIIEQHLYRLNPQSYYVPPSGGYVGCVDACGRVVMTVYPGFVEFKRDLAPPDRPDLDYPGLLLSTFRPHASPTAPPDEGQQVCPIHHIALPLTGICDDCQ